MDPGAHLGFVVYGKLNRWYQLGFRSEISRFFSIKDQIVNGPGFAAYIVSLLTFLTLLFFQPLRKVEISLFWKKGLQNSPKGLYLAYGHGSSFPIFGNTILTLKISIIAQRGK